MVGDELPYAICAALLVATGVRYLASPVGAALSDPDNPPLTPEELARMRPAPQPRRIRERLKLTQEQFAEQFEIPLGTLRDWEQHRSTPDAPARALLRAIEREPETMRRLLSSAA